MHRSARSPAIRGGHMGSVGLWPASSSQNLLKHDGQRLTVVPRGVQTWEHAGHLTVVGLIFTGIVAASCRQCGYAVKGKVAASRTRYFIGDSFSRQTRHRPVC